MDVEGGGGGYNHGLRNPSYALHLFFSIGAAQLASCQSENIL